jgi:hypothetical protein
MSGDLPAAPQCPCRAGRAGRIVPPHPPHVAAKIENQTPIKIMKIDKIAGGLVKLCRKGRFDQAADAHYSEKIVSLEPAGDDRETKGLGAVKARGQWWVDNHTIHKMTVEGPFIGKSQFVVRFLCDVTFKPEKRRFTMDELAIYTVKAGKIVRAQFFYHAG